MSIKPNNFVINAADLAFILKQIKLAEATSAGYTSAPKTILQAIMETYGVSAASAGQLPFGLRTVDGTFNNLMIAPTGTPGTVGYNPGTSEYGAADTLFPRLTTPVYNNDADGDSMSFAPPGTPGAPPPLTNTNYANQGSVADADPRIISNLIVSMSANNAAAVAVYLANPLSLEAFEAAHPGKIPVAPDDNRAGTGDYLALTDADLQAILNQSPDIGLSPGFNSWMTFFGQFFDHGLDLVTKGNAGTVYIPLQADDPLIAGADGILVDNPNTLVNEAADNLPAHLQFMALTRATQTLDANGVPQHENTTTSWIDQNQTYTSHASHQVFLREYVKVDLDGVGVGLGPVAVSTGRLLDGTTAGGSVNGAIGNWAEVKAQAITMLGIKMGDFDVHNAPLLATDQYGKFLPGSNGYAQVAVQIQILSAAGKVIGSLGPQFFMNGVDGGLDLADLELPTTIPGVPGNLPLPPLPAGQTYHVASVGTGHAFLNDIAHHAAPAILDHDHNPFTPKIAQVADDDLGDANGDGILNADRNGDGIVSAAEMVADDHDETTYDDEMLNAHFITGDGRGNENIALTTVHSIFHSEHNRAVEADKATILDTGDLAFINEWLRVDITSLADIDTQIKKDALLTDAGRWDGERLFQAGRFSTEMQYQHLVFEEFARKIQPMVDPFVFQNSPNIDPSIFAEFAHTVYRFGHSMLTGTVDRLDNSLGLLNNDADQATLLAVFLNPQAYIGSGATVEQINANIVRGLSRDVGNQIDEFIVTDVRSNLLGLPLDLGALNIARGRDTGIPSLNETRAQLYNDTGLADLKPYASWADFATNLRNAASIVNFIAAYGTHATITSELTLAGKRAAAEAIVFNTAGAPADRIAFLNATGIYARDGLTRPDPNNPGQFIGTNEDSRGGLENIDLWIGGLAEASPEFGGMLGTTFNYVFEAQMESLQDGDRMYYLSRTQGLNMINQLEPNSFADLVMRNTELGDKYATHVNGLLFVTPDNIFEMDGGIAQEDYNPGASGIDPLWAPGEPHSPLDMKVTRTITGVKADGNHDVGGTFRFIGGEHTVVGGTEGDDWIYTDRGIDTLWGDGGNDYLNAGTESDQVFGGEGDDIIEDPFGDNFLRGNAGNDVVASARGFNLLFGNEGMDVLILGQDAGEVFGGTDTDFILGGQGVDGLLGNEGDDWIEGGQGLDTLAGDNSDIFFNSPIVGHDVLFGQGDENDIDAESGDDIMGAGPSIYRYEGMYGFDYVIAKGDNNAVDFDLSKPIFTTDPAAVLRDRFDHVESLSGGMFNDVLRGDSRGHFITGAVTTATTADALFEFDILNQEGINRINGFNSWFGGGDGTDARQTLFGGAAPLVIGTADATNFRDGNILMGGDGNDTIHGNGGFDLIDGDAYLNVRIGINLGGTYYSAESLNTDVSQAGPNAGKVFRMVGNNPTGEVNFAGGAAFNGRSLTSLLLDRTINPGQMSIVREIKHDATNVTGAAMNIDTAVFHGRLAEYDIEGREINVNGVVVVRAADINGDGFIAIRDRDDGVTGATVNGVTLASRKLLVDDTDLIKNIEQLRFADQTLVIEGPNALRGPSVDLHYFNLVPVTTASYLDAFNVQAFNNSDGITPWTTSWFETNDGTNEIGTGQIQTNEGDTGAMRFLAGDGASITRAISLDPTATTTLSYVYSFFQIDAGETLKVEFASNGVDFVTMQTIAGAVATNANLGPTVGSLVVNGTANSAVRFTVSALTDIESMRIADVAFVSTKLLPVVAAPDGTGFASTFTEDGVAVRIASLPSITDPDHANLLSAQVRLTNAQALDVLSVAGALPVGLTAAVNTAVAGQVTLTISGSASKADYQTAIEAVRYSTTSQNPSMTPRTIEVTATSAAGTSAPAMATVNMVAVNDAPVTVADVIVTNVSAGSFAVPEWALLANDTDVDSPMLDITAVSAAVGITGLSLVTSPGSVTLSDGPVAGGSFTYTARDGGTVNATANGTVTLTNLGFAQVADDFTGASNTVRSTANNSSGTTPWATSWTELGDDGMLQSGQIRIDAGATPGSNDLRFAVGDGASIQRGIDLAGASAATLTFSFDKNNIDVGESVLVQFAADGVNFVTLSTITNTNGTNGNGNAAGTLSLPLTGALSANSMIRFVGSGIDLAGEDIRIDNVRVSYAAPNNDVTAGAGNQILVGNGGGSQFNGGAGNDTVFANGGNDTINWSVGDGRDFVDGGANDAAGDRFVVNGDNSVENFIVYARAEAIVAGITGLNAATEIVVTRNGVVISELDNIEEITINTADGADTVSAVGNFTPTSLFFNTVTVNGGGGPDTIDASLLTSAHRLVLVSGASDVVVIDPQDSSGFKSPFSASEASGMGQALGATARDGIASNNRYGAMELHNSSAQGASTLVMESQPSAGLHYNPMLERHWAADSNQADGARDLGFDRVHRFDVGDYLIL